MPAGEQATCFHAQGAGDRPCSFASPRRQPCPVLTVGVERLPEGVSLGHGHGEGQVLEARDAEDDRVLIVGQVLRGRHRAVQRDVPGSGDGESRAQILQTLMLQGSRERSGRNNFWRANCSPTTIPPGQAAAYQVWETVMK